MNNRSIIEKEDFIKIKHNIRKKTVSIKFSNKPGLVYKTIKKSDDLLLKIKEISHI